MPTKTEAREQALREGKCAECKTRPRTNNADGQLGKRCEECKQKSVAGKSHLKKQAPVAWIDPDEHWQDTAQFAEYRKRVTRIVKDSDKVKPAIHIGEIHRILGEDARKDWTPTALQDAIEVGPWRFTYRKPEVKYVNRHLWGTVAVVPENGRHYDPRLFPSGAIQGRTQRKRGGIKIY